MAKYYVIRNLNWTVETSMNYLHVVEYMDEILGKHYKINLAKDDDGKIKPLVFEGEEGIETYGYYQPKEDDKNLKFKIKFQVFQIYHLIKVKIKTCNLVKELYMPVVPEITIADFVLDYQKIKDDAEEKKNQDKESAESIKTYVDEEKTKLENDINENINRSINLSITYHFGVSEETYKKLYPGVNMTNEYKVQKKNSNDFFKDFTDLFKKQGEI